MVFAEGRRRPSSRWKAFGVLAAAVGLLVSNAPPAPAAVSGTLVSDEKNLGSHSFTALGAPSPCPNSFDENGNQDILVKYANYQFRNEFHVRPEAPERITVGSHVFNVTPTNAIVALVGTTPHNGFDGNWWFEGPHHSYPRQVNGVPTTCANAKDRRDIYIDGVFTLTVRGEGIDRTDGLRKRIACATDAGQFGRYRRGWKGNPNGNFVEFVFPKNVTKCQIFYLGGTSSALEATEVHFNLKLATVIGKYRDETGREPPQVGTPFGTVPDKDEGTICDRPIMPSNCVGESRGPDHIKFS